ncbi:hypothetical protein L6259_03920 [Candidatus Parcubacteria bacterium]|nr:hypothetical protein [Patescibacteria group bacterium]MCG2694384.1 hypothetical protein [Candidatus Parcubacteria bacterium]
MSDQNKRMLKEEDRTIAKIVKLIQQHIFQALTLSLLVGMRFRFYFRDGEGRLKILGAQVVSWQFQGGKLFLDTSSPSIKYLLVDKDGLIMVENSDIIFRGKIEVY